jgi:hypothetical protein
MNHDTIINSETDKLLIFTNDQVFNQYLQLINIGQFKLLFFPQ